MIMEEAIGKQISDYLIKPVNPHQILMAIKKLMEKDLLVKQTPHLTDKSLTKLAKN